MVIPSCSNDSTLPLTLSLAYALHDVCFCRICCWKAVFLFNKMCCAIATSYELYFLFINLQLPLTVMYVLFNLFYFDVAAVCHQCLLFINFNFSVVICVLVLYFCICFKAMLFV